MCYNAHASPDQQEYLSSDKQFRWRIVIPILFDRLTKGIATEQQLTLIVILGFILALIALVITNSIFFRETTKGHEELLHNQGELVNQVELLASEFGLLVHFIEEPLDNSGITYERTRQLIEQAQTSLVFLDAWVQTKDYFLGTDLAQERRKSYYNTIVNQIEKHKHDGTPFHRRIVQVPRTVSDLNTFRLVGGSLFIDYMKSCLKIRKEFTWHMYFKNCSHFFTSSFCNHR